MAATTKKTTTTKAPATKKADPEIICCKDCANCRDNVLYGTLFCSGWGRSLENDKGFCHKAVPKR